MSTEPLKNSRHEAFAQAIMKGMPATRAYVAAGYSDHPQNAKRLTQDKQIAARVAALQRAAVEAAVVDKAYVMRSLYELAQTSLGKKAVLVKGKLVAFRQDGPTATRCLELLGRELGMFVEHVVQDTSVRVISAQPVTEEDWEARYAAQPMIEGNGHDREAEDIEAGSDSTVGSNGHRAPAGGNGHG